MKHRRGYVLITCLLLLAIGALIVASTSRMSVTIALESRRAEAALQQRWAMTSMVELASDHKSELLTEEKEGANGEKKVRQLAQRRWETRLSGLRIELLLSDENAKLNLNVLLANMSRNSTRSVIRELVGQALPNWQSFVELDLVPQRIDSDDRLSTWGQTFKPQSTVSRNEYADAVRLASQSMTLWTGRGAINIKTASDAVLEEVLELFLTASESKRFLEQRIDHPEASLAELLSGLDLSDRKRETAERFLTDASETHGIWIRSRSTEGDKTWFVVGEALSQGVTRTRVFEW